MAELLSFAPMYTDQYLLGEVLTEGVDGIYEVRIADKKTSALRCASCLLAPQIGDVVILLRLERELYLTHIITQSAANKIIDADTLLIKAQAFALHTETGQLSAQHLDIKVKNILARVDYLKALGKRCLQYFKKTIIKSELFEQNAEQLSIISDQMHEFISTAKVVETPMLIQKTAVQHINTQNFSINS